MNRFTFLKGAAGKLEGVPPSNFRLGLIGLGMTYLFLLALAKIDASLFTAFLALLPGGAS